jgi:hypothetical protein
VVAVDSIGLRLTLPGPEGSADAFQATGVIQRFLVMLWQLEDAGFRVAASPGEDKSSWRFQELRLGSVVATVAPRRPRTGGSVDSMNDALFKAVEGLAAAEEAEGIPAGWTVSVAQAGLDVLRLLPASGLELELLRDGQPIRSTRVSKAAADHLAVGLKERRSSIGSVIGRLESATLRGRREASLWPDRGTGRIQIAFEQRDVDVIRNAWGKRVEVRGIVERDADGTAVKVRMRNLDVLAESAGSSSLADLVGADPDITDGLDVDEYLREIRDAAQ